jgi:hypothetical protein
MLILAVGVTVIVIEGLDDRVIVTEAVKEGVTVLERVRVGVTDLLLVTVTEGVFVSVDVKEGVVVSELVVDGVYVEDTVTLCVLVGLVDHVAVLLREDVAVGVKLIVADADSVGLTDMLTLWVFVSDGVEVNELVVDGV